MVLTALPVSEFGGFEVDLGNRRIQLAPDGVGKAQADECVRRWVQTLASREVVGAVQDESCHRKKKPWKVERSSSNANASAKASEWRHTLPVVLCMSALYAPIMRISQGTRIGEAALLVSHFDAAYKKRWFLAYLMSCDTDGALERAYECQQFGRQRKCIWTHTHTLFVPRVAGAQTTFSALFGVERVVSSAAALVGVRWYRLFSCWWCSVLLYGLNDCVSSILYRIFLR
jgi:hypothetical protein